MDKDKEIFKEGQVVWHKASGRKAVVIVARKDRGGELNGYYALSTDFSEGFAEVDGDMLTGEEPKVLQGSAHS